MNYSAAFVQLPLVREPGNLRIASPADAHRACCDMAGLAQESLHVLCLNGRHALINRHMVSLGLADSSLAHCREVFRPAVADGASGIVLVHNHTTGDTTPSAEDLRITRQMIAAGKIIGIGVLDHVIIGRASAQADGQPARPPFLSLRDAGLCDFT